MKNLILATVLLTATVSQAEVITCDYTEPFYSVVVDTTAKTVSRVEYDWEKQDGSFKTEVTAKGIEVKEISPVKVGELESYSRFAIVEGQKTLMVLTLDYQGNNGMADSIYPYSTGEGFSFAGCYSEKLKPVEPSAN